MATLYITEHTQLANADFGGAIQAPLEPHVAEQTVAIGASSEQSNPMQNSTRLIRVHTDAACHIAIGENPTANTLKRRMIADSTEFFGLPPYGTFKIAVIQE